VILINLANPDICSAIVNELQHLRKRGPFPAMCAFKQHGGCDYFNLAYNLTVINGSVTPGNMKF
jgi:hypothetical protein